MPPLLIHLPPLPCGVPFFFAVGEGLKRISHQKATYKDAKTTQTTALAVVFLVFVLTFLRFYGIVKMPNKPNMHKVGIFSFLG